MKILIFTLLMFPLCLHASPFSMTEYECAHMDVKRDGIKCMVSTEEGIYRLLIRYHITKDSHKDLIDRAKYQTNVVIHSFIADGGQYYSIRRRDKKGIEFQKDCVNSPKYQHPICQDWQPIKD